MFPFFKKWHKSAVVLFCCDLLSIPAAYFAALYFRFDCSLKAVTPEYWKIYLATVFYYTFAAVVIYWGFRLYHFVLSYASYREFCRCIGAGSIAVLLYWTVLSWAGLRMPISYHIFGGFFQITFLFGSRFSWRLLKLLAARAGWNRGGDAESAMLIGAGNAGQLILRDLSTTSHRNIRFRCIIDDDPHKWGCYLEDVPIVGGREVILSAVKKHHIQKIYIALPAATAEQRSKILDICKDSGCETKILPGLYQFSNDEVSLSKMRNVDIYDLLGREPVVVDEDAIADSLKGQVVLVTGGGGSIGAEICRQVAAYRPKHLIVMEVYENNAVLLQYELMKNYPDLNLSVLIGSVRDPLRVAQIFETFRPDVVFHAAAHKHLVFTESSPCEAIKDNVIGTYNTACAALSSGCGRFLFLSTDKAVNPSSILGACSRICEMMLQAMETLVKTGEAAKLLSPVDGGPLRLPENSTPSRFSSIRFGNAFGSEGSVFKLFQKQIETGGPVIVTHKEATRFCMSVPGIVQLILQAAADSAGGEVYVVDMGSPFNIDTIARNLIRMNGLVPDEDIRVEYSGLRPGEKLYEEVLMWEEGMLKTRCPRLYSANPTQIDIDSFLGNLQKLFAAARENSPAVRNILSIIVHSYHPSVPHAGDAGDAAPVPINHLEQIAMEFDIQGSVKAVVPMNKGYINRTYRVDIGGADGTMRHFTLQRINTNAFKSPKYLMNNLILVTEYLSKHFRLPGSPYETANQRVILTKNGEAFYSDHTGDWRMLTFFDGVHSYDVPESPFIFYQAGVVFGSFLKAMSGFDPQQLFEVIPDFHNTWKRYQDLEAVIADDPLNRVSGVQQEIEFIRSHRSLFRVLDDALKSGELPLRVGHNDCNLNNILFRDDTNRAVAIIDLDTVMPSTPLYDFGDSMRVGTNPAKDDEKDLTKVFCELTLYEHYARGWLESCGDILTRRELELLPLASLVISCEDGIRFLTDYLDGDSYYYTSYFGQNLDRARTQLHLAEDMERKLPQIREILNGIYGTLNLNGVCGGESAA